jgi:hypothetical protein
MNKHMARIRPEVASRDAIAAQVAISLTTDGTIGSQIDSLNNLREQKRILEASIKTIEESYAKLEESLMEALEKQGMDKATGKKATVSISASTSASIEDDTAFFAYVKKTGFFHLFQRRLSDPAVRELLESKGSIPGIKPFIKRRLNLRSL